MTHVATKKLRSPLKWHPDWPHYAGDEDGNIHSGIPGRRPRQLKPWVKECGHLCVSLRRDGKTHKVLVHRFILELFVGPCPEGLEACHGKAGPAVNAVWNLRWDTHQQNMYDRFRQGQRYGTQKLQPADIPVIQKERAAGVPLSVLGERYGVTGATISHVARGKTWGVLR